MIRPRDPRTGATQEAVDATDAADLDAIAAGLRELQPGWAARTPQQRADELLAFAERLTEAHDELVEALVADTGRRRESIIEVDSVIGMLRRWAATAPAMLATPDERDASLPGFTIRQRHVPYPLVGVISPWNFPLLLALIDTIPALAAGCAVLLKPSEVTPRFALVLRPLAPEAMAVVIGDGGLGAAVVDHVDLVCFTGSVATGRKVAQQAAANLIPANLELGGKDPAIVLPGTDLARTARALLWASTSNAGQACQSIERVYVHRSEHDALVEALVEAAEQVGLAWPSPSDPGLGPIISMAQVHVIERHLADAIGRGAKALTGGEVEQLGGGMWMRPTVLVNVDHDMLVMTEETFAPIIGVMAYDTVDEAVELANDSDYGLSAAVFGPDVEVASEVAARLQAGAVSINDAALTALVHDAEKQSFGISGLGGSRMGPAALRRFGRTTAQIVNTGPTDDPWWWPPA